MPTRAEREEEMVAKRMTKLMRQATKKSAEEGERDVEKVMRQVVESKEHIGRIRGLVIERAAAHSQANP